MTKILKSVTKTGRLLAIDGDWASCGLAGEIIAGVCEKAQFESLKAPPRRVTLVDAPAPTSAPLEKLYYPTVEQICSVIKELY